MFQKHTQVWMKAPRLIYTPLRSEDPNGVDNIRGHVKVCRTDA